MTDAPDAPQIWSKRRWWLTFLVVLLGQLAIISWLNEPEHPAAPAPHRLSIILPADRTMNLPYLRDPTLSALPTRNGFSGAAWLQVPAFPAPDLDWTEPPRWLALRTNQLGSAFEEFVSTNAPPPVEVVKPAGAQPALAEVYQVSDTAPKHSTVRVGGQLANRPLVAPLEVPSWPASDMILANTVVQVAVGADGRVFSAHLLRSSGAKDADSAAVDLARSARFQPLPGGRAAQAEFPSGAPAWGTLIFRWLTVAPSTTNATAVP